MVLGFLSKSLGNSISCNILRMCIVVGFCSARSHSFLQHSRAILCEEYFLSTFSIAMLKVSTNLVILQASMYSVSEARASVTIVLNYCTVFLT